MIRTPGRKPGAADLPAGLRSGARRNRVDRPIKNGRWYLARPGTLTKVGWGDLSFAGLTAIAADLDDDEIFLAVPEHPPGGQHLPFHEPGEPGIGGSWCWYDRPDDPPGPTITDLTESARYAVLDNQLRYVDQAGIANRLGAVWIKRGYRYTRTGRILSTGKVRLLAVSTEQLHTCIAQLVGNPTSTRPTVRPGDNPSARGQQRSTGPHGGSPVIDGYAHSPVTAILDERDQATAAENTAILGYRRP